jgi:hypothetical protein
MRRIRVTIVAVENTKYCILPGSSTLSHKRHDLREKVIEGNMCFDFLNKFLSETFLILRGTERNITNLLRSPCNVTVILVRF